MLRWLQWILISDLDLKHHATVNDEVICRGRSTSEVHFRNVTLLNQNLAGDLSPATGTSLRRLTLDFSGLAVRYNIHGWNWKEGFMSLDVWVEQVTRQTHSWRRRTSISCCTKGSMLHPKHVIKVNADGWKWSSALSDLKKLLRRQICKLCQRSQEHFAHGEDKQANSTSTIFYFLWPSGAGILAESQVSTASQFDESSGFKLLCQS